MTLEEDLIENYKENPASYFSKKYDTKISSVYRKACELGLTKGPKKTERIKDQVLKEYYENKKTVKEVSAIFNISKSLCLRILKDHGSGGRSREESAYKKYECNEDFFEIIDTPEKAYWFGFIAADGNIYNNKLQIGLAKKDKNHLEKFCKRIGFNGQIYKDHKKLINDFGCKLIVARKKIVSDLKRHGMEENKTHKIDETIFDKIPEEFFWNAFHGYFDGDGCFTGKKYLEMNLLGNESFLKFILDRLREEGLDYEGGPYRDKRTKHTWAFSLRVTEKRKNLFKKLFYEGGSKDFLERKKEKLYYYA